MTVNGLILKLKPATATRGCTFLPLPLIKMLEYFLYAQKLPHNMFIIDG